MIKLTDLINTEESEYVPYMHSSIGFGCHVCRFYYEDGGKHYCGNEDYQEYKGTNELVDEQGNQIKDPSKWCSNWFLPANS